MIKGISDHYEKINILEWHDKSESSCMPLPMLMVVKYHFELGVNWLFLFTFE